MMTVQPLSGPAGTAPLGHEPSPHMARTDAVKDAKGREPLYDIVMRSLDEDQAQEVIAIPLEGKSAVADFMVIASGR